MDTRPHSPRWYRLITHKFKVTPNVCHSVPCRPEVPTNLGVYSTPQPHNRELAWGIGPTISVLNNKDGRVTELQPQQNHAASALYNSL